MKLHLGCGKRFIPGYVHVDVVDYPHITLQHEVDSLPMIQDGAADVIYACHVLEHFHRRDTRRVLDEWHRILRPGGVLRVAVPDFKALAALYEHDGNLADVIGPILGRQDYLYNIHRNLFDFPTLEHALRAANFDGVRHYDWRATEHADVDDYSQSYFPHMDKEHGVLLSLNVEAVKR